MPSFCTYYYVYFANRRINYKPRSTDYNSILFLTVIYTIGPKYMLKIMCIRKIDMSQHATVKQYLFTELILLKRKQQHGQMLFIACIQCIIYRL